MTIYFQGALRPVCRRLARAGVTANQVTIAALLLSLVLGGLLALFPAERRPLFLIPAGLHAPHAVWIVVLALTSEMTGVVAVQIGASRRYDRAD